MKKTFVIFVTDDCQSVSSRELIGVASTERNRDRMIRKYLRGYLDREIRMQMVREAEGQIQEKGHTSCLYDEYGIEIMAVMVDINELF